MENKKIIAIDLGSTLSEVSVLEAGKPVIIVNEEGYNTTPSVVAFSNNEKIIGAKAKRQQLLNPKDTIVLIKRFMGCTYDEVKEDIKHVQYEVINENGYPRIKIGENKYTPEEISAMILMKLKTTAENYLSESVSDAIITVPAYFNDAQRQATKRAGEIAGLNVLRIIAEPTAAILSAKLNEKEGKYMVVDYGGATLDFSIAEVTKTDDDNLIEILASSGDVYCGGSDIDKIVAKYIEEDFYTKNPNCKLDMMAISRIRDAAETAKIELSNTTIHEINLPYITVDSNNTPIHYTCELTRAKFESLIYDEINKVISKGKDAIKKANITNKDLNGILLVGGSTRIPYLQEQLRKEFAVELIKSVNPDEAVALGAAIQAGVLSGSINNIVLLDVTPLDLGIDTANGLMAKLIEANTTIPVTKSQIFTTASDNQYAVDIMVVQGNRPMSKDNKQIGMFRLDGIAPAPRGVPQIEVSFNIDVNGIVTVTAKDKATNKEQHITIENNGGLSSDDIEKMKKEAEQFKASDDQKREEAEFINKSESTILTIEKLISSEEFKDKITDSEKETLKQYIDKCNESIKNKNLTELKINVDDLNNYWNPIIAKIYGNQQQNQDIFNMTSNPFSTK